MISDFSPPSTVSAQACGSLACRVVMESRATEPIEGSASPRNPSVRIWSKSSSSSLDVAWRSTASARSFWRHAAAVIGDADPPPPAAIGEDVDPARAGIDRVLDEFLDHARRALDHLAGGDAVDDLFWKLADGHGRDLGFDLDSLTTLF